MRHQAREQRAAPDTATTTTPVRISSRLRSKNPRANR